MPTLSEEVVRELIMSCMFEEGESRAGAIIVEGVVLKFGFHPERLAAKADEIGELLAELPDNFKQDKGGGWSFLKACQDRHGNQWTGLHQSMDMLFCLGIAAGKAKWQLPRAFWNALPGGMPYVVIT